VGAATTSQGLGFHSGARRSLPYLLHNSGDQRRWWCGAPVHGDFN